MTHDNKNRALAYDTQARYFLESAALVSQHIASKGKNPSANYKNFETVIIGTNHSFAAEILLKGIIFFHNGSHPKKHEIEELLNHQSCEQLKARIIEAFQPEVHTSYTKKQLEHHLRKYILKLDENNRFDKKEIEKIESITEHFVFGTFEYFLKLHSNHFIKMRYACECFPPPLDMNFTSFLNNQLRNELEVNLLEL
ncbi:HEPN domain-containing protein [Arcticibacterium luteifluviistationis]|uniref:HEPN domain-containing protein n=1 Tax=Arcticibacterium luteifluviistationis TaxID=1784714 RepID=A0A2Z4GB61_9BACT|nr:HEPN domain-containing protein [Arcticibacterium luteifluviistationis]AWV98305.1 hypothetical protein DJ013_09030 [Arcticibacterium luteifluviistationis]